VREAIIIVRREKWPGRVAWLEEVEVMALATTWRSWLLALFGAWFVVDSFVYSSAKAHSSVFWSFLVIGALILLGGLWLALKDPLEQLWRSWALAVLSAWMAVSPWALGYQSHPKDMWITLVVGVIGVAAAVWHALAPAASGAPASHTA
jgi:hypothetical protein